MEAVDDSGVAVVVHPDMTKAIYSSDQGPEGVQEQGNSAVGLAVDGVDIVLQAGPWTQLSAALCGLVFFLDA